MTITHRHREEKGAGRLGRLYPLLRPVLDEVMDALQCQGVFLALMDPATDALDDVVGLDIQPLLLDLFETASGEDNPIASALRADAPVRVDNIFAERGVPPSILAYQAENAPLAFVAVPLPPAPAVLVASATAPFSEHDVVMLLPSLSRIVALLAEGLGRPEARDAGPGEEGERDWLEWMTETVPDPIIVSDEQNNILVQNVHAERLLEAAEDDSPGKRHAIGLNNFLLSAAFSSFALDQGEALGRELVLVDPIEGSDLLFEVICRPVVNRQTGMPGLVTVLKNVTDLQRAIEEPKSSLKRLTEMNVDLALERNRLNLVLANVANPIVVRDQTDELVPMNQAAARLLQLPADVDTSDRAAYYSNNMVLNSFLLDFHLDGAAIKQGELPFIDPIGGDELTMNVVASKVRNEFGQVVAIVSVLHDLTQVRELERRRLERQLFESEKLAAVGRVTAAVAHEINNPLEAIKNSLHLLVSDLPQDSPNRAFLDIANKEIMRVSGIIRQMLGFYRTNDAADLLSVNAVVEQALALLQRQLMGRHITVEKDLDPDLPRVLGSSQQLTQVLLNLFLNSTDAMPEHGELQVVTRHGPETEPQFPQGEYVWIEVRDSGVGIAAEHLPHIFEPFFSTKREQHGTGLGLWVSDDIVRQHGGHIKVKSRAGHGTTFAIALPLGGQS